MAYLVTIRDEGRGGGGTYEYDYEYTSQRSDP